MTKSVRQKAASSLSRRHALAGAGTLLVGSALPSMKKVTASVSTNERSGASGQSMPSGDLAGWKQVLYEDFGADVAQGGFVSANNGSGLLNPSSRGGALYGPYLGVYDDGISNIYGRYASSKTISTKNSIIDIYCHTDGATNTPVAAAIYPFRRGSRSNGQTYGRWSYRMRITEAQGSGWGWAAMLWPENGAEWPQSGEVDWPEGNIGAVTAADPGNAQGWFHIRGASNGWEGQRPLSSPAQISDWHTYTIEWLPNSLKIFIDGRLVGSTNQNVPTTRMRWVLQVGPGGDRTGRAVRPTGSVHVQVDWITAYDPT